jgi:hypothetical protein
MIKVEQCRKNCEYKRAGLGSAQTAREPGRPVELHFKQMSGQRLAPVSSIRLSKDPMSV